MKKRLVYGKLPDNKTIYQFILSNKSGAEVRIINYGATITNILVPDKSGDVSDVVLGYENLEGYINDNTFMGGIVGRYANRIAKGRFQLNGKHYQLSVNNGNNHLHGGIFGFHKKSWNAETSEDESVDSVKLSYFSIDGEEGYPGNLELIVTYTLTNENELIINYEANTDKPTLINPTHHSYFNLTGNFNKRITDHELQIEADEFIPVDAELIPTGKTASVKNTPMDFRNMKLIGLDLDADYLQLKYGTGYDHNWALNNFNRQVRKAASLLEPDSGIFLELYTDQPGLQFYSGNYLDDGISGKGGIPFHVRSGLCLETQCFPDSPNNPDFPSTVLNPGEFYKQRTIYRFSVKS